MLDTTIGVLLIAIVLVATFVALGAIALVATYKIWWIAVLNRLASREFLVVNVEEGTGRLIIRFSRAWRFITSDRRTDPILRYEDNDSWNVEDSLKNKDTDLVYNADGKPEPWWVQFIEKLLPGGMRWVGFSFMGYRLFPYNFRWAVYREDQPKKEEFLVDVRKLPNGKYAPSFAQRMTHIFLRDTGYYFDLQDAPTKGSSGNQIGPLVNVYSTIIVRIVNPYLALINIHDWLGNTLSQLRPAVRSWIAQHTLAEVVQKNEVSEHEIDEILRWTPSRPPMDDAKEKPKGPMAIGDYLECTYGVRVKNLKFEQVTLPAAYVQATTARANTEQEALGIATLAEAEKKRQLTVAEGEAGRLRQVGQAMNEIGADVALALRGWEAVETAAKNGSTTIFTNGPGQQALINLPDKKGGK